MMRHHKIKAPFPKPHSPVARLFHWGFLGLFVYGISKGLDNVTQLADSAFWAFEMSFASVFLAVLGLRYWFMRRTRPTVLDENTPKWLRQLARLGHLALYTSLALIALSGLIIGGLFRFGIAEGVLMDTAIGFHEVSINASYLLIAGHVLAAIGHRILGDGVWSTMVPILKEKPRTKA